MRPLKIFFDGGCRPNPGRMEAAIVVRGVPTIWGDLGQGDNSLAEWLALVHAAEAAVASGGAEVVLLGDSAIVVGQANGVAPCRSPVLAAQRAMFVSVVAGVPRLRIRRIGRAQNLAGIALERRWGRR